MLLSNQMFLVVFASSLYSVLAEDYNTYTFCDHSHSNVVHMNASSPPVLLHSPNYDDGTYTSRKNCPVVIKSGHQPLVLSLCYNSFDLEWDDDCFYDSLCVYGVKFCGHWLTGTTYQYIMERNSNFTLYFRSDSDVEKNGFEIQVSAQLAVSQTIQVITGGIGCRLTNVDIIPRVYGPEFYYTDKCAPQPRTTRSTPRSTIPTVKTTIFQPTTIRTTPVLNTTVRTTTVPTTATTPTSTTAAPTTTAPTTAAPTTTAPTTAAPTTTAPTTTAPTTTPLWQPTTKSDRNLYTFCEDSPCNVVNINASSPPILIQSPNFGNGSYNNNQHCSVVIKSGEEPLILSLNYRHFGVQWDQSCSYDSLCVYGVKFCGLWLRGREFQYILQAHSSFTMDFRTDNCTTFSGFKIRVTAETAFHQTVDLISSGVGSDWININFITVLFSSSFSYTDKCSASSESICYPRLSTTTTTATSTVSTTGSPVDFTRNVTDNNSLQDSTTTATFLYSARNITVTGRSLESTSGFTSTENPLDFTRDTKLNSTINAATTENPADLTENVRSTGNPPDSTTNSPEDTTITISEEPPECDDDGDVYTFCEDSACSFVYISAANPQVLIHSPNYDDEYNHNQHCSMVIASGEEPLILSFYFNDFNVEYEAQCIFDSLCINGVKYCGTWLTRSVFQNILPAHSYFTLDFITDNANKRTGFEICLTAEVAIDQTVDLVSSGVGSAWSNINITTDDYKPSFTYTDKCSVSSQTACYPKRPKTTTATTPYLTYYTSNATATDNLEASTTSDTITDNPQDKSTTDNPHDFTRNVTSNPQYSTPRAITTSIQPTSTTGTNIPTTVSNPPDSTRNLLSTDKSLDESTKIIIHTDNPLDSTKIATNTENQTDFTENITTTLDSIRNVTSTSSPENPTITITEESPECDDNDDNVYTFCEDSSCSFVYINTTNPQVVIRSPDYDDDYNHNQHCSVVIVTDREPLILSIHYKEFDVEYEDECFFDSLCVHGVRFCGTWLTGYTFQYMVPAHSFFTLDFVTDCTNKRPGFEIFMTAETAIAQTIDIISSGVGSSWSNVNIVTDTYQPSSCYTDKCSASSQTACYPKYSKVTASTQVTTTQKSLDSTKNAVRTDPLYTTSNLTVTDSLTDSTTSSSLNFTTNVTPRDSPQDSTTGVKDTDSPGDVSADSLDSATDDPLDTSGNDDPLDTSGNDTDTYNPLASSTNNPPVLTGNVTTTGIQQNSTRSVITTANPQNSTRNVATTGNPTYTTKNATTTRNQPDFTGHVTTKSNLQNSTTAVITTVIPIDLTKNVTNTEKPLDSTGNIISTTSPVNTSITSTKEISDCEDEVCIFCDRSWWNTIHINATSPPVVIQSPYFGDGVYPDDLNCSLTIWSGEEPLILHFNYIFFELQDDDYCTTDSLCVNGVKLCGSWLYGRTFEYILPAKCSFTLKLKTDSSVRQLGFEIQLTHEVAQINQTVEEATEGIGSDEFHVVYTNVTFSLDYSYRDKCLEDYN